MQTLEWYKIMCTYKQYCIKLMSQQILSTADSYPLMILMLNQKYISYSISLFKQILTVELLKMIYDMKTKFTILTYITVHSNFTFITSFMSSFIALKLFIIFSYVTQNCNCSSKFGKQLQYKPRQAELHLVECA